MIENLPVQNQQQKMDALTRITRELFPVNLDEVGITFNNPLEIRKKIQALEDLLASMDGDLIQIKTTHKFAPGLYVREVFIPKGTILIGKIHRHPCVSIMTSGDKTTLTEEGVRRIKAPFTGIAKAGIKRVGFAHEDTIWTTIHATNETDLEKLEKELITTNYEDVDTKELDVRTLHTMEGKLPAQASIDSRGK